MEIDGRVLLKKLLLTTALTPVFLAGCMPVSYPRDGAKEDVAVQVPHDVSEEVSTPSVRPKKVASSKKTPPSKKTLDFTDEDGHVYLTKVFYYSGELQQETSFYPNGRIAVETNFSKAGGKVKECFYLADGRKNKELLFDSLGRKLKEVFYQDNKEVCTIYYRNGVKVSEEIVDEAQSTVMEKRYIAGELTIDSFTYFNKTMRLFYRDSNLQSEQYFQQDQPLRVAYFEGGAKIGDMSYDETGLPQDRNLYKDGNLLESTDFVNGAILAYTNAGCPFMVQEGFIRDGYRDLVQYKEFPEDFIVKKTEQPSLQQPFLQQGIRAVRLFNNRM